MALFPKKPLTPLEKGYIALAPSVTKVDGSAVVQPVSGEVTVKAGENVNTSLLATKANQATEITKLTNLDTNLGAKADASASSDTGTFSLISLFKRLLESVTTLISSPSKEYYIEIARGNVPGHSLITKFGFNDDIDAGTTPEDIWGASGTYAQPTAARTHNFVSTSASDTMTILIRGINGSYNAVSETITMNGLTPVTTANSYVHIHLLQNTGSSNNVGTITGTANVDGTLTITMPIGYNQSTSSIYMIPVDYKGYLIKCRARLSNATANSEASITLYNKPFGGVFQVKTQIGLNNSGASSVVLDYSHSAPFIFQAKSIVKLTCVSASNNNTNVQGEYDLILIAD